jgi:hypothetical protein
VTEKLKLEGYTNSTQEKSEIVYPSLHLGSGSSYSLLSPNNWGDSPPKSWGDSLPKSWGDSLPKSWGDSLPKSWGDSLPKSWGDSVITSNFVVKDYGVACKKTMRNCVRLKHQSMVAKMVLLSIVKTTCNFSHEGCPQLKKLLDFTDRYGEGFILLVLTPIRD